MNNENKMHLIKRLFYQSCNRGCKETDILMSGFAKENLDKMTHEELKIFDEILQLSDADIYDWYTKKKEVPKKNLTSIMKKLLRFNPTKK